MNLPTIHDVEISVLLTEMNANLSNEDRLVLDATRREAVVGYSDIQACPGSGKTTLVGLKLLLLARQWNLRHSGVCVLTHTNVAKDEILKRLSQHPLGAKLSAYPHFVGTIQDFTHTFLALPYCRSVGVDTHWIDDRQCEMAVSRHIRHGTRAYLERKFAKLSDLRFVWKDGAMTINVPTFPTSSESDSYKNMKQARITAARNGYFYFSEMYEFAKGAVSENPSIVATLRARFPVVLVDEMQDTQKPQDDLIESLFRCADVRIQRFGDPDQAIFDGLGGFEPPPYNSAVLTPISDSKRFVPAIAILARGLSTRGVALAGTRPIEDGIPPCTLLLYEDKSIANVIDSFGSIVSLIPASNRRIVKAVGGVGQNSSGASPLNLTSYWPSFERSRAPRTFSPSTFCEAARRCNKLREGTVHHRHHAVVFATLQLLALTEKTVARDRGRMGPVTAASLRRYLRDVGTEREFRILMARFHMEAMPTAHEWPEVVHALCSSCGIANDDNRATEYLAYSEPSVGAEDSVEGNFCTTSSGVIVEVGTIHSVKGETHDATLVLETKHQKLFDLEEMLPHLIDDQAARPVYDAARATTRASLRATFMKRLYVALTRPRRLACMAMHKDRITQAQRTALASNKGWSIVEI